MTKEQSTVQTIVLDGQKGRLDKVLTELMPGESRSVIQKMIKDQLITVDQAAPKANFKLTGTETIEITQAAEEEPLDIQAEAMDLDVVYEDGDVLVLNKAAGIVVHPSKGHATGTLVNGLLHYLGQNLSDGSGTARPGIVHRIDKDTSGLLVVAKNNKAHQHLSGQLEARTMKRQYIALVHGKVEAKTGTIEIPLKRDEGNRLRWKGDIDGKHALTTFEVIETHEDATLLELALQTGRTHQIRVHMEHIGHPIIGDPVYRKGVPQIKNPLAKIKDGQLLHAQTIAFDHPTTGERLSFTSEIPERFRSVIQSLSML